MSGIRVFIAAASSLNCILLCLATGDKSGKGFEHKETILEKGEKFVDLTLAWQLKL